MADEEDLARLKTGELDLSQCDFRGANLSGLDLSNRDFTGAFLDGAFVIGTNFSKSSLRNANITQLNAEKADFTDTNLKANSFVGANFQSAILRRADLSGRPMINCNFEHADLVGANFRSVNFMRDNIFNGAQSDETTNFEGARITRAPARNTVFRFYEFKEGRLVRRKELDPNTRSLNQRESQPPKLNPESTKGSLRTEVIERQIRDHPHTASEISRSIEAMIEGELLRLEDFRPNDQIQIEARNNNIAFLKKIQTNLAKLDMQLVASIQETSPDTKEIAVAEASTLLQEVQSAFNEWLDSNAPIVVQGAMNVGVIGILGFFLTFMGCPPFVGFGLAAAATSKKKPYDALLEMISNFRTTGTQRK